MFFLLGLTLVFFVDSEASCPRSLSHTFYQELGCLPKFENNSVCPTSFDCAKYESRLKNQCYHNGDAYDIDTELPEGKGDGCSLHCRCSRYHDDGEPTFNCANVECPEHFGGSRVDPGCHLQYEPGKCCSTNVSCDETASPEKNPTTCTYGNTTYFLGQKFYPEDDQCKVCYCKENFRGVLEPPFCHDLKCDELLHSGSRVSEGCVPVYYGQTGCCPIDWKCPSSNNTIQKVKSKISTATSSPCKFGTLRLQPGEILETDNSEIECSCILPPYLTCVMAAATPS